MAIGVVEMSVDPAFYTPKTWVPDSNDENTNPYLYNQDLVLRLESNL